MQINDRQTTSGTLLIKSGEVALVETPTGSVAILVEHRGGEPTCVFENEAVKLIDCHGPIGTTLQFLFTHPKGAMNLRFHVSAHDADSLHLVHYVAVAEDVTPRYL